MNKTSAAALLVASSLVFAGCRMVYLDAGYDIVSGSGGASTSAGSGGSGGAGGELLCMPGAMQSCYDGPAGTDGQGICKTGTQTCAPDGASWGPCVGAVLPQVENCATASDDDCDGFSPECTGSHTWSRRFGDTGAQIGNAIAVDENDNIIIAGQFSGTLDFGGGVSITSGVGVDAFVAKLAPTGVVTWARSLSGSGASRIARAVVVDNDGAIVVCGDFYGSIDFGTGSGPAPSTGWSDLFVAKLTPAGDILWGKRFGGPGNDEAPAIAVDPSGNVVITGNTNDVIDFGGGALQAGGGADLFVAKLDAAGQHVWSKRFGDAAAQVGRAVAVSSTGDVVLAAQVSGVVDVGCGPMPDAGGGDLAVVKLDSSGGCLWSRRYGDGGPQDGAAVAVDGSGNVVLLSNVVGDVDLGAGALMSAGGKDVAVAKLDTAGGYVWARRVGDGMDQVGRGVALDGAGNVVVTGYFGGAMNWGGGELISTDFYDVFMAKLDAATGGHLWSKRFGDVQAQYGSGVDTDSAGNPVVVGYFSGTIDFGGNTLKSTGGSDIFVVKFSQ